MQVPECKSGLRVQQRGSERCFWLLRGCDSPLALSPCSEGLSPPEPERITSDLRVIYCMLGAFIDVCVNARGFSETGTRRKKWREVCTSAGSSQGREGDAKQQVT